MIALSWILFTLLALFWTAAAWIAAAAAGWAVQAVASGTAEQAAREAAALPLPEALKVWVDPAWLQALQSALQWAIDNAGAVLALAGPVAGWLIPAIWIGWGAGMLLLLVGAVGGHVVLRRLAQWGSRPPMAGTA